MANLTFQLLDARTGSMSLSCASWSWASTIWNPIKTNLVFLCWIVHFGAMTKLLLSPDIAHLQAMSRNDIFLVQQIQIHCIQVLSSWVFEFLKYALHGLINGSQAVDYIYSSFWEKPLQSELGHDVRLSVPAIVNISINAIVWSPSVGHLANCTSMAVSSWR